MMGSKKRWLTAKPWERWHDGKVHGAEAIVDVLERDMLLKVIHMTLSNNDNIYQLKCRNMSYN